MNPMGSWLKQLSGIMAPGRYTDGVNERDPAKIAYIRRLQKAMKQQDHLHIPFSQLTVTVFDLETTGFYPLKGDRILSIGAQKVTGYTLSEQETFYSLMKSDKPPSKDITELTGITADDVINAPSPEEVIHDFLQFTGKDTLVAHHASHETRFMRHLTWSLYKTRFEHRILDTSFLTALIKSMDGLVSLDECCQHYSIDTESRHHAFHDAVMTAKMWVECVKEVESLGFHCLKDVYSHLAGKQ
ncbi:3'-5' exoribonuclease [Salipaludibacillus sp. LMS25]|jgi:DNA polymerase-3 subunit epsilon|uniref:exonuclease domain-containing protein n=1 Tax=Salipaludibacillus sp. LMS25 TaxID=2924031 RepID=UPI0020D0A897|nr:exonuclease domain-containing protein [Salipaludibacillus sp. LMS25]UTR14790.1 3'-5' exoribonuclease [Salipaludibacillus sp. LMS25]